ncbi:MAG: ribonuclease E activity regulator RraA [Gammaproteobacteria bacterium]|nr:ribonuclease E activity regulator RraA [Gammaproteobacteria bacterium]
MIKTTDICDHFSEQIQIADPLFGDFGGQSAFHGPISTVKLFEDNVLLRQALEEQGEGRVLVVDGGGSLRHALMGDMLAAMGEKNGWAGVLINGCIRDSAEIAHIDIGVKALGTMPLKSLKQGLGERDIAVRFAGLNIKPGDYLYADEDGIVISHSPLHEKLPA